jgi:hypothetical protein
MFLLLCMIFLVHSNSVYLCLCVTVSTNGVAGQPPTCQRPSRPQPSRPLRQRCRSATQLQLIARTSRLDLGAAIVPGRLRGARPRTHLRQPPRRLLARSPQAPPRSGRRGDRCTHRCPHRRGRLQQPAAPLYVASDIVVRRRRADRRARAGAAVLRGVSSPVG